MRNKALQEMSNEELLSTKKKTAVIAGLLAVTLLVQFVMFAMKKEYNLLAIPFALSTIVILNYKKINEMKRELKSRGL
ncbi:redox-active disulfide protein 2 [Sphingobacterium sp. SRCM116780]|uniref:redox-active disulfide protein 2 n=1 Tax=Sphingobacterium sp. SRCM116780 TaxID=2907623 RepID=UPI001F359208|nr:redox-active disulfide protein 2 [Sphingobacterium sp. SRCM116780]UIR57307.1 redox-active disulfide protein 2 [Sphingobacterium sp. SRCM116780]